MKYIFLAIICITILSSCGQEVSEPINVVPLQEQSVKETETESPEILSPEKEEIGEVEEIPEFLNIQKDGSDLVFENILADNSVYTRYQISYTSE